MAIGVLIVVALIAACAPSGLGPTAAPPSDAPPTALAIAAGLAPGTFATVAPGSSFGSSSGSSFGSAPTFRPSATGRPGPKPKPSPGTPGAPIAGPTPSPKATPTPAPTPIAIPPLSHCQIFPSSNQWNLPVNNLPVASDSATMIAAIGQTVGVHPDFDTSSTDGIPYNIVGTATPRSTVTFQYSSESDHVGYPIPAKPKIEGGSDRHLLMIDTNACKLYELFDATLSSGHWHAGSGATWSLDSNAVRPAGWTSADAAGLPIFPGLARYEEVAAGAIDHALRFTAPDSCAGYIYPARHEAGGGSCSVEPPMGLRVRLKASFDISHFSAQTRVILQALKTYGMILADNGSPWYISGAYSPSWDDSGLHNLNQVKGSDFEVVDTSGL